MPTMWLPRVNSSPPLWSLVMSLKMMDLSAPQLAIWTLFSTPGRGGILRNLMAVMLDEWSSRVLMNPYSRQASNTWIRRSRDAEAKRLKQEMKFGFLIFTSGQKSRRDPGVNGEHDKVLFFKT